MAGYSEIDMRITGRAAFAAAAYLIGVGVTFILERIGGPDALVRNLGPSLGLAALALVGALSRSSRADVVFSGDPAASPSYAAAALAAIAAGLAACLSLGAAGSAAPFGALAAGLLIGAVAVGPFARRRGASSLGDLLAARFPGRLLHLIVGAANFAIGALIAGAGFEAAVGALSSFVGVTRETAIGVVSVTVLCVATPGGLSGLVWAGAAAAGVLFAVLFLPILIRLASEGTISAPLWRGAGDMAAAFATTWTQFEVASPQSRALEAAAIALGVAIAPPTLTAAFVSSTRRNAARAGILGLAMAAGLALSYFVGAPLWQDHLDPAAVGLRASAGLIAAVICAAAGAQAASRALGAEASGYGRQRAPSSQRLAAARQLAILSVALCAFFSYRRAIEPSAALIGACALSLCVIGPAIALAASARPGSAHVLVAIAVSFAVIAGLAELQGWAYAASHAAGMALTGAAAGFAVGWAASLFRLSRRSSPDAAGRRIFLETPIDPGA